MKEIIEFRIFEDYYHLLSKPNNALFNGAVYVIKVEKGDRIFEEIKQLSLDVKLGLLRPEPIYFCSQAFRKMVEDEKLCGFEFEIANIE